MKKVLALVLSVLMVLSLSVVAFAKEVEAPETTPGTDIDNADKKYELGFGDLEKPAADAAPDKPGATYYYTILDEENQECGMLTDDEVAKHLSVSIKEKGDKMIKAYSIVKQNGVYKVKVETNTTYTTSKTSADWTITLKRDKKFTVASAVVSIAQQWAEVCDIAKDVDAYGEAQIMVDLAEAHDGKEGASYDDYTDDINIEARLVLAKSIKYAEIYFGESPVWYSVKNAAKTTVNVYFDEAVEKALSTTYEDADLYAISFKGAPEFDFTGIEHVSVDEDMFVYAVVDGKLVADKFSWNKDTECWEMNTKKVVDVVVSDIELDVSKYNSTIGGGEAGKDNPGTGSVDFVNVAVALGVVSLAAAGAVALKK
ncbi:MAG: hypothetical protein PUC57_01305 [Oscillospiraceae bacterium]|nr:hypothetical protein [Oscillospiraceae bacterium]